MAQMNASPTDIMYTCSISDMIYLEPNNIKIQYAKGDVAVVAVPPDMQQYIIT